MNKKKDDVQPFRAPHVSQFLLSNLSASLSRSLLLALLVCLVSPHIFCQLTDRELLVAAAADLAPLQDILVDGFRKASGQKAIFTLASSGMLARQVRMGAPYDLYLSANEVFIHDLVRSGHVRADSVRVYAYGRIALWSKDGSIRVLSDLLDDRVRHVALANPTHAPYGVAAREALRSQGLWDKLTRKLVYGENVRQAFEYAASGNADAVIAAWTLVFDKGGILLPEGWHAPIRQAGGIVTASGRQEAARQFLEFLTGSRGRQLLEQNGLFPPGEELKPAGARDRK